MDFPNIRITRRQGDTETSVEIGAPEDRRFFVVEGGAAARKQLRDFVFGPVAAGEATDTEDLVAGDSSDMATALQNISKELGCQNTEDGILHAIDALRAKAPATLEWSGTLCDGERVDYAAAEKACAALGEGWRLPTRPELESILALDRHDPAIDEARFPGTKSGAYWTSTPCAWSSGFAWIVSFNGGYVDHYLRDDGNAFVRAVRSVPAGQ